MGFGFCENIFKKFTKIFIMFHRILSILVIILSLIDIAILLGIFGVAPMSEMVNAHLGLYAAVIVVQIPILYAIIYFTYISPIQSLTQGIARFYTGLDEDANIPANSWSKGMNDVIVFFQKSLQILKVFKSELRDGRKLRSEVEIAAEIQNQSLSVREDKMPGLDVAVGICSASEVGGDNTDIIAGQDGNYYLYVGDVTGHGVASGFVMMMVNALIAAFSSKMINSAEILAATNAVLKPRIKQNMMMTAVMLRWDSVNGKMYYSGAGHEFLLVYKAKEKQVYKVKSGGVALGMMKNISRAMKEQQISFEPGDLIILYTDGITEARYRSEQNGMLFGVDRIVESIMKNPTRTPQNVFEQITIDLSAFMGYKYTQYDDITLAVVGFTPSGSQSVVVTDIPAKIQPSSITEWNW